MQIFCYYQLSLGLTLQFTFLFSVSCWVLPLLTLPILRPVIMRKLPFVHFSAEDKKKLHICMSWDGARICIAKLCLK